MANGGAHSSLEPIRLPGSAAKPFGAQSEWPAFGMMRSGSGAPPQSPAASPARSNGSAASGESRNRSYMSAGAVNFRHSCKWLKWICVVVVDSLSTSPYHHRTVVAPSPKGSLNTALMQKTRCQIFSASSHLGVLSSCRATQTLSEFELLRVARSVCYIFWEAGEASLGCLPADCASIQAQVEFNQPFSDDEDEGGQHSEGPHSKAQRLRGASQQSLTGLPLHHLPDVSPSPCL